MRVAIIATPWLAIPVKGYGGIELVVESLVNGLLKMGIDVELFTNGQRRLKGVTSHCLFNQEQFINIHRPIYEALPILAAHIQFALNKIKQDGGFDIIHDHNGYFGPELLAWASADKDLPPIVHTHHGPPFSTKQMIDQGLPDNNPYWLELSKYMGRLFIVGISDTLMKSAPDKIKQRVLPTVYNAIDLRKFPFVESKQNYFITLARFTRDKGQHIAAKICAEKGYKLRMAGTIDSIGNNRKLLLELANPLSPYRALADFRYYSDNILNYTINNRNIVYSGNLGGAKKIKFISNARALLFPISWEEPFGMSVIEAMACGTPVVAMNRGAMPEIIEQGINGFLANDEAEFAEYMDRVGEIDPNQCRECVARRFSSDTMAAAYIDRYQQAIEKSRSLA